MNSILSCAAASVAHLLPFVLSHGRSPAYRPCTIGDMLSHLRFFSPCSPL